MSQIQRLTSTSGPGSGTVTSISAATGITLTPNPITTTGTVGLTIPVVVTSGGTGFITATTAYAPIVAGTTPTNPFQVASTGLATAGFVLTSNGSAAVPSFQAAPTGAISWSVITADQTAAVNHGYFCNKASTLALALPATSAVGDIIEVSNINTATGVQFTQAVGQQIFIGNTSTTLGATGTLTSIAVGDALKLVCRTANLTWYVVSSMGNWTPA